MQTIQQESSNLGPNSTVSLLDQHNELKKHAESTTYVPY